MPPFTEIPNATFSETIDRAIKDVYHTMLSLKAVSDPYVTETEKDGVPLVHSFSIPGVNIIGTVGFLGELNGLLSLYISEPLAIASTSQMLGMTPAEVEETGPEVINDTIGELTNMTSGAFKNQLADRGYPCKLTIPSVVKGEDILLEHSRGSVRRIYRYKINGFTVYVDVQLKESAA